MFALIHEARKGIEAMGMQEALVWNAADLASPGGATFGAPCATKSEDLAAWNALTPVMTRALASGSYIMAIVQTRNTRSWNVGRNQYDFKVNEDYIIASYAVSATVGNPYVPGTVVKEWLAGSLARSNGQGHAVNPDVVKIFQCSDKGCNLSTKGAVTLVKFFQQGGSSYAEAVARAFHDLSDGMKYGWRGGKFSSPGPQPSPGRQRAGAFMGQQRVAPTWTPGVLPSN